jgi:DNA-binding NtrC family response regulator
MPHHDLAPRSPARSAARRTRAAAPRVDGAQAPAPKHALIGPSQTMQTLRRQLERLAKLPLPILIHGETGTGKELAARTLHDFAEPTDTDDERPFVGLNCGAIPAGLFESELFGHRRGAFTGAERDHAGAFVRASGGTVFLDEVGELPLSAQIKLLRVLETRRLTPLGSDHEIAMDCRVVAATHRDLRAMIDAGQFREDLFHRLGVVELELPPLRRRRRDIPVLLGHFVELAGRELGRPVELSPAAIDEASRHSWPGNVRALRNAVLRAAALADGPIGPELLLPEQGRRRYRSSATISVPRGTYASMQAALLRTVVAEEGSIRKAARALEVPRSTLGAWLRNGQASSGAGQENHHDASGGPIGEGSERQGLLVNAMANGRGNSHPG